MLIVDGHQDPAMTAMLAGRDYRHSAYHTRQMEIGTRFPEMTGECMLGLPELRRGGVGIVIATLSAIPAAHAYPGEPSYETVEEAHQLALAQLDIYREWTKDEPGPRLVTTQGELDAIVGAWEQPDIQSDPAPVGLVLLMENADPIRKPSEVCFWYEQGVRLIGPAWHTNRYTASSGDPGGLTELGRELLREMDRTGMILDITHMADEAARQALDLFSGTVVASHTAPRTIVDFQRLLPDDLIGQIAERDGIIGIMPLNWALVPGWSKAQSKAHVHLDAFVDAVDAICRITGDTLQVGIGTDFDGGQGAESAPAELDTVADLPKLADCLRARGYDQTAIESIMSGNWLRVLRQTLPD